MSLIKSVNYGVFALLGCFAAARSLAADAMTEELYSLYCESCHSVESSGAPLAFVEDAWEGRRKAGMDKLLANAITGVGNMPPQGMCIECTEDDLVKLIEYMSSPR